MLVKTLNHEKSAVDCEVDEPVFHSSGRVGRKSCEFMGRQNGQNATLNCSPHFFNTSVPPHNFF